MIDDPRFWRKFAIAILATWRITHLLAREDGPVDVFVRVRERLGSGAAGKLMDCFHCLSVWIAAPMTLFLSRRPGDFVPVCLALSGAACLLEQIGQEPVLIRPAPQDKKD
jgi:hypothetical protein